MRGGRSLLVLFVAFGGLLAYLYFVDAKKPVTEEGVEKRDKVFTVDAEKVDELKVRSSSGETSTLKKAKDGWQLVEPITAKVDDSEVTGITSNLASAEIQSIVDEAPKDLQPYGLDKPRFEVAFKAAGDKEYRRLLVGGKAPAGGDLYAQRAGEKARVRDSLVRGEQLRSQAVRPPRQEDPGVRSREGGSPRDRARRREAGTDQGWPGLEHHRTGAGAGGFQRRRIHCHASAVGADEVASRGAGSGSEELRSRQARGDGHGGPREHARDPRIRQGRPRAATCTRRT